MPTPVAKIVSTKERIAEIFDQLVSHYADRMSDQKPTIYIDLEGIDLCREDSISILKFLIHTEEPAQPVHLIDGHTLGASTFNIAGFKNSSATLKSILRDENIPKVFFDVRNDSGALFTHFGIELRGV